MRKGVYIFLAVLFLAASCRKQPAVFTEGCVEPPLYPHYADTLVIPCNIAPLNFMIERPACEAGPEYKHAFYVRVQVCNESGAAVDSLFFRTRGRVMFGADTWRGLCAKASQNGGFLRITVNNFKPVVWYVSPDSIDPYLVCRAGPFDDNAGGRLQTVERNLENFSQRVLIDNALTDNNCMNCHAVGSHNSNRMVVHVRNAHAGTLVINDTQRVMLSLPDGCGFRLSYPAWNPVYPYLTMATTVIAPQMYVNPHRTQDMMLDAGGRIVLYNTQTGELFTDSLLSDPLYEYTFPAWSPSGKELYFCRVPAINPDSATPYNDKLLLSRFQYNLYKVKFNPETLTFDSLQEVYNFRKHNLSASMPDVRCDGRYILVSGMLMGSFSSQNQGDLFVLDAETSTLITGRKLNTPDADRCGRWSGNGCWFVFGSKRENGANALLYLAHFNPSAPQGKQISVPFAVPQKDPAFYKKNTRMFIFPVFSTVSSKLTPENYRNSVLQESVHPVLRGFPVQDSASQNTSSGH